MTIETIYKLELTPNEKEILTECRALLNEIIQDCGGYELNNEVEVDSIVSASDTLLDLIDIGGI